MPWKAHSFNQFGIAGPKKIVTIDQGKEFPYMSLLSIYFSTLIVHCEKYGIELVILSKIVRRFGTLLVIFF